MGLEWVGGWVVYLLGNEVGLLLLVILSALVELFERGWVGGKAYLLGDELGLLLLVVLSALVELFEGFFGACYCL